MATVRLSAYDIKGVTVSDGSRPPVYVPQVCLWAWVHLGGEGSVRQALVDTGAPVCQLAQRVWRQFHTDKRIEWLAHPPRPDGRDDRSALPRLTGFGGRYPFRLGRIRVVVSELDRNPVSLPPVDTLFQLVEDTPRRPGDPPPLPLPLILGLARSPFAGRELRIAFGPDGNPATAVVAEPD